MTESTLSDYMTRRVTTKGAGLELEVEGTNLPAPVESAFWSRVREGSLRNGFEYVTQGCVATSKLSTALNQLYNALEKHPSRMSTNQARCGTHVHVNMQPYTISQIRTVCAVFILLDDLLSEYCGRRNNLFCKPLSAAEETVTQLAGSSRWNGAGGPNPFGNLTADLHKYSSINFAALGRFGTIEFRAFPFFTDRNPTKLWVKELAAAPENITSTWKTAEEFLSWYFKSDKTALLEAVFSKEMVGILQNVKDWEKLIAGNRKLTVDFVVRSSQQKKPKARRATDPALEEALEFVVDERRLRPRRVE